jgi:hypothetical protein
MVAELQMIWIEIHLRLMEIFGLMKIASLLTIASTLL